MACQWSPKIQFQYMLLLRGATITSDMEDYMRAVSIHAPLARSNTEAEFSEIEKMFQYMLLLRGATLFRLEVNLARQVSIHAPLARSNIQAIFDKLYK